MEYVYWGSSFATNAFQKITALNIFHGFLITPTTQTRVGISNLKFANLPLFIFPQV